MRDGQEDLDVVPEVPTVGELIAGVASMGLMLMLAVVACLLVT